MGKKRKSKNPDLIELSRTFKTRKRIGKYSYSKIFGTPYSYGKGLTFDVKDIILQYVAAGCHLTTAAAAAGVSTYRVGTWRHKGKTLYEKVENDECTLADLKPRDLDYYFFYDDFKEAEAWSERSLLAKVQAAEDWKAAKYLLERRFPERWKEERTLNIKTDSDMSLVDIFYTGNDEDKDESEPEDEENTE